MERSASWVTVTSAAELRSILGEPAARVATKDRPALEEIHRRWLAASPVPSRPQIARLERPEESLEVLERYYGADDAKGLYGSPSG